MFCSRVQKRKYEDDHASEHGNFDMAEIREHEEFTKVKNIERIELGRYEMETWYFSPFPEEFKDCKVRRHPHKCAGFPPLACCGNCMLVGLFLGSTSQGREAPYHYTTPFFAEALCL
jgi:hypothetical protein